MGTTADARTLGAATQAHVRRLVILAVRGGMKQTEAATQYRVSLRAVNKWAALARTGGLKALRSKRRGGPLGQADSPPSRRRVFGAW